MARHDPTGRCVTFVLVVVLSLVVCQGVSAQVPEPPENISPPHVTGTPTVDETLTADPGEWSGAPPPTFTYQWLRCDDDGDDCEMIAKGERYTATFEDMGRSLRVRVTASNPFGEEQETSVPTAVVTAPPTVNTGLPGISGTAREGQVLRALRGEWTGLRLEFAVQWERCGLGGACSAIQGAESESLVLSGADLGTRLRVAVTATNPAGSVTAHSAMTAIVAPAALVSLEPPTISGEARVGRVLQATSGRWSPTQPTEFLYRWLRCWSDGSRCAAIPGATEPRYEVRRQDLGSRLGVRVTALSDAGSSTRDSEHTAVVTAIAASKPPRLMRPFPRVRIRGYVTDSGAVLDLVTLRGPRRARIALSCRGGTCPFRHRVGTLSRRLRIRSLERFLPTRTTLVFRVTQRSRIGKHTKIVIRAGRPPARRDRCVMPGSRRPVRCPVP